jgi:hypothetical protein
MHRCEHFRHHQHAATSIAGMLYQSADICVVAAGRGLRRS